MKSVSDSRGKIDFENSPLNLLWLTETYFPSSGGMAQSCDRIVFGLRRAGVTTDLVHLIPTNELELGTSIEIGPKESQEQWNGWNAKWKMGSDPAHDLNCLFAWLMRRESSYTHVVAFGGKYPLLAAPMFSSWMQTDLVTLLRGNDFDTGVFSVRNRPFLFEALRRSRGIGVVTQEMERRVSALFPEARIMQTGNGIDLTDWNIYPKNRDDAQRWAADNSVGNRIVIGCFGHLKRKKGIDMLVEASARSKCAENVHFHLVGSIAPELESFLKSRVQHISVTQTGHVKRSLLPAEYAKCDFVAIPSYYDGMPNVMLEAGGLGVPLIASDAGGMSEVVEHGVHGFRFAAGDIDGCVSAIQSACTTTLGDRQAMGAALRHKVSSNFAAIQETRRFLHLFNPIVVSD